MAQPKPVADRILAAVLWILAALSVLTGLHMIVAPAAWYASTPGVPDTGPLNIHFVRDIGIAFLAGAAALSWGLLRPAHRRPMFTVAIIWFGGHALSHLGEIIFDGHHHNGLAVEVGGVLIPAAVMLVALWRDRAKA